jgi:transposase-like protein
LSRPGFDGDLEARMMSWRAKGFCRAMSRPKKYPDELVRRGVRLALENGRPIAHIATDSGMHPETLRKKVRRPRPMAR